MPITNEYFNFAIASCDERIASVQSKFDEWNILRYFGQYGCKWDYKRGRTS